MSDLNWKIVKVKGEDNVYIVTVDHSKDAKVRTARKEETRRPFCGGRKRTRRIADLNENQA